MAPIINGVGSKLKIAEPLGGSAIFNLLPTPLIIGATTQLNYVSGIINEDTKTNWVTVGLVFGVKIQDKLPSIFDIDLPNILDIF